MKAKWTGDLVGKMHIYGVTQEDLAAEMHVTKSYVSMILNGDREPAGGQERLQEAFKRVLEKRSANKE